MEVTNGFKGLDLIVPYRDRREEKGKGKKERYTHLNAEFQRIARRGKAFLTDQCKETDETNKMENGKELFKKIRATKRTFHAKMGTIQDRKQYGPNRSRKY